MTTAREFEQRRWIALALLCVAQFVVVLDASITNVALPTIGESLNLSQDNLSWVVNAYVLTFGGFLLLGHSESLLNVTTAFELVHLREDLVYRKPAATLRLGITEISPERGGPERGGGEGGG